MAATQQGWLLKEATKTQLAPSWIWFVFWCDLRTKSETISVLRNNSGWCLVASVMETVVDTGKRRGHTDFILRLGRRSKLCIRNRISGKLYQISDMIASLHTTHCSRTLSLSNTHTFFPRPPLLPRYCPIFRKVWKLFCASLLFGGVFLFIYIPTCVQSFVNCLSISNFHYHWTTLSTSPKLLFGYTFVD